MRGGTLKSCRACTGMGYEKANRKSEVGNARRTEPPPSTSQIPTPQAIDIEIDETNPLFLFPFLERAKTRGVFSSSLSLQTVELQKLKHR